MDATMKPSGTASRMSVQRTECESAKLEPPSGNATAELSASGQTTVKGAMVMDKLKKKVEKQYATGGKNKSDAIPAPWHLGVSFLPIPHVAVP